MKLHQFVHVYRISRETVQSAQENSSSEFNLPVYARTEPLVYRRVANHQGGIPNEFFLTLQEANHELPFYMKIQALMSGGGGKPPV